MRLVWLVTLLLVPGLLGLLLVMEWLERRFTLNLLAADLARLLSMDLDPAALEAEVTRQTAPLFARDLAGRSDKNSPRG